MHNKYVQKALYNAWNARSIFSAASSPRPHDRGVMFLQHRQIGMTDPGSQGPQIDTGDCRARTIAFYASRE
jgi:hypothetical protein